MSKKIILTILALGFLAQLSYSQDYTFRVLASNGQSKVKPVGAKWKILVTGYKLNLNDKLKLSENSYLGLVHASGKTLELKQAGTYDIIELANKLGTGSKNLVSKYADFVLSKMTPEVIEENRRKYASVTGSGERGLYDTGIHLFLPKTGVLLNDKTIVSWDYKGKNPIFIVEIKNIFGELILTAENTNLTYAINYNNDNIKNAINNIITVKVKLKNNETITSQEIAIRWLDELDGQELKSTLLELELNLGKSSSLNNLILAEFYEENGLILDAITSYENALMLSPDINYFQEVYDEFLIRNELKIPELIGNKK